MGRGQPGGRHCPLEVAATRRRFTRGEYYRIPEVAILDEDDRVELIRGEIVEMSPIVRRHGTFVGNLNELVAGRAIVWMQNHRPHGGHRVPAGHRRPLSYEKHEAWADAALFSPTSG